MNKVSIIVPTYNRAHSLKRSIISLLDQTYKNFEIIIIDDGSTDNTEKVIKDFNTKKIKYFRHEQNKGVSAARNMGIRFTKSEYIAFQDSDDEWLPKKLQKQMEVFEKHSNDTDVVYTGCVKIKDNKIISYHPLKDIKKKEGYLHDALLKENFIAMPTILFRKDCLKKVGEFDVILPQFEDWEFFIRLSKYYKFKCINETLVKSYYTKDGVNEATPKISSKAIEMILLKHSEEFIKHRKILAKHYFLLSNLFFQCNNHKQGRYYNLNAIKKYPFNINFWKTLFKSFRNFCV